MCGVCPPSAECSESTEIQKQAKVTICPSETLMAQGFSEGILRLEGSSIKTMKTAKKSVTQQEYRAETLPEDIAYGK